MADSSIFSERELGLLQALVDHQVEFMVVGLSAATLHGAPVVTQDVDLWIKDLSSSNFKDALQSIGASYVPTFGFNPPSLAGEGLGLFDLVMKMSGLQSFDEEKRSAEMIDIGGVAVPVLSLERIIHSKRSANRDKDKLVLPVLEDVLKTKRVLGK